MSVYKQLSYGRKNAIPSKDLAQLMGFRSVRELQKAVEAERAAGAVILSDPSGGGYYLSNDPVELRRFTNAAFTQLPEWVQEQIKKSTQYQKEHTPTDTIEVKTQVIPAVPAEATVPFVTGTQTGGAPF